MLNRSRMDIRNCVLAENVEVSVRTLNIADIKFEFVCRNCGERHQSREIDTLDSGRIVVFSLLASQLRLDLCSNAVGTVRIVCSKKN